MARMTHTPSVYFTVALGATRDELWSADAQARARELGYDVRLNPHAAALTPEQWARELEGVEALITTWKAPCLDEATLALNTTLRIVGHAAGSVAGIVSHELYRRGVRVVTANREMARTVSEWALMMTMVGLRGLLHYAQFGAGRSLENNAPRFIRDPHTAVIGIWGYGDVARNLIRLLRPLEPREIIVCDPYLDETAAAREGVRKVEFDEIFARADVIHLLTGLTDETTGRVGAKQLAAIKDGATFVNCGRAKLIDYDALIAEAAKERFTLILDVHHKEPPPSDYPLRGLPNVIMTPHCAGKGRRDLYVRCVLDEFDRFFRGEPLQHEIGEQRALNMTGGRGGAAGRQGVDTTP